MRERLLHALTQPIEDLKVLDRQLGSLRDRVALVRAVEAKVARTERAFEAISLALALAELCAAAGDDQQGDAR